MTWSYVRIAQIIYDSSRQSLLSLHMTKSYVRTATRSTLKVEAKREDVLRFNRRKSVDNFEKKN